MSTLTIPDLSDMKVIGPGLWFSIHLMAKDAVTIELKNNFIKFMDTIARGLKCSSCKQHAIEHLSNHPIIDFFNIKLPNGTDVGMFKWTFIFHNSVNARINKKSLDWNTAYGLYNNESDVCEIGCDEGNDKSIPTLNDISVKAPNIVRNIRKQTPFKLIPHY